MKNSLILLVFGVLIYSCSNGGSLSTEVDSMAKLAVNKQAFSPFTDFWNQGKAEITTYDLQQARYGEIHEGTANTIFVTEPFSKSKHVKLDYPGQSAKDLVPAMKLNFTRKFYTGVYPYSTMLSVFTAQDLKKSPHSLKAVFGAQEWCGQTFTQLNLTAGGYEMEQFSYFESEGDKKLKLQKATLEDELWNIIRINPEDLPVGKVNIIPGLTFSRLGHVEPDAVMAEANLAKNGKMTTYTVHYPQHERTLTINFKTDFPHEIESWKEKGYSGFGANRKILTTTATLNSRKMLEYWSKHSLSDAPLRTELGL